MAIEPMKLKLQATRAVLREKDLAHFEEEQLPKELPKTLWKELAELGKMRAGKYRACEVFTKVARIDGLELTANMWEIVSEGVTKVQVGDEVETFWEGDEGQQRWAMKKNMVEGYITHMDIFQWGQDGNIGFVLGSFEDGRMVVRWWDTRQGAPTRQVQVTEVYVDSRDNLVLCDNWMFEAEDEEKVEIKVEVSLKFRRIE